MHMEVVSELVSGYAAYADAGEFTLDANGAAPASSPVCMASAASSVPCAAYAGGYVATLINNC